MNFVIALAIVAAVAVAGLHFAAKSHKESVGALVESFFHHTEAVAAVAANSQPATTVYTAPAPATASGSTSASAGASPAAPVFLGPPVTPGYVIVDSTNGLVKFDGQDGVTYWGEYAFAYEGAKLQFDGDSQPWQTINWNCGQEQFASTHPDFLAQRAVIAMVQVVKPGSVTGELYWKPTDAAALPKTLALPNHIVDTASALAYIRGLTVPGASNNAGFHS